MKKEKLHTTSGENFTQFILEIFRLNGLLGIIGDELVKNLGLTSSLWKVLGAIDAGPLPMAQIARDMGLTRQSVRRTANLLHKKGFVEFQNNPNHKRAKLVVMTKKGRNIFEKIQQTQIDWSNHIAQDLNLQEIKTARRILKLVSDYLEKNSKGVS